MRCIENPLGRTGDWSEQGTLPYFAVLCPTLHSRTLWAVNHHYLTDLPTDRSSENDMTPVWILPDILWDIHLSLHWRRFATYNERVTRRLPPPRLPRDNIYYDMRVSVFISRTLDMALLICLAMSWISLPNCRLMVACQCSKSEVLQQLTAGTLHNVGHTGA